MKGPDVEGTFEADAGQIIARHLLELYSERLPDWHRLAVIVPHSSISRQIRRALLDGLKNSQTPAFAGLAIQTLRGFIDTWTTPLPRTIDPASLELMLVEALRAHPDLYNHGSPWALASELVPLFEQLTLNESRLPASLPALIKTLRSAYGEAAQSNLALEREAALVHTLWNALRAQLAADRKIDSHSAYLARLTHFARDAGNPWRLVILPDPAWSRAEQTWAAQIAEQGRATLIVLGHAKPPDHALRPSLPLWHRLCTRFDDNADAREQFWEQALSASRNQSLQERAHAYASRHPQSPIARDVHLCTAPTTEIEARVIEMRIRLWFTTGKKEICVVTDDRHLARRLRALLERSGITLNDCAGWALSTTRAAALLERWLECIENEFEHTALLDVLHSPLVMPSQDQESWRLAVFHFDRDIIRRENARRDLDRYRHHLQLRLRRLPRAESAVYDEIEKIISMLQRAAAPLIALRKSQRALPLDEYRTALLQSLESLNARQSLENDRAGQGVLEAITALHDDELPAVALTWTEFRTWLGRTVERHLYVPENLPQGVTLLSLAQSIYQRFYALLLGGMT